MRAIFLIIGMLLVAGCVSSEPEPVPEVPSEPGPEEPTMTCEEYCPTQPHIECVGTWNISGTYPDCVCEYNCDVEETPEEPEEVPEPPPEEPEEELTPPVPEKTLNELIQEGVSKAQYDFYTENDGTFEETTYTWKRHVGEDILPGDITIDTAPLTDVRFDGEPIQSLRGVGLVVFDGEGVSEVRGVLIFLSDFTALDSKTTFDIRYFPSLDHRNMEICLVKNKDMVMDSEENWISTYYIKCEDTSPNE